MVKQHKNWRGCDGIDWVSYNECADPDLVYGDYVFNYWDIEDALWNEFCEERREVAHRYNFNDFNGERCREVYGLKTCCDKYFWEIPHRISYVY